MKGAKHLREILKSIDITKATRIDKLPGKTLKDGAAILAKKIIFLFNFYPVFLQRVAES